MVLKERSQFRVSRGTERGDVRRFKRAVQRRGVDAEMLADSSDRVDNRERYILVRFFATLDEEVACAEQVALDLPRDPRGKIVLNCSAPLQRRVQTASLNDRQSEGNDGRCADNTINNGPYPLLPQRQTVRDRLIRAPQQAHDQPRSR